MRFIRGLLSYRLFVVYLSLLLSLYICGFVEPQISFAVDGEVTYTSTNTNLMGDDSYAGPFNIGFTFTYYGVDYTQAYVNINGTVNFGAGSSEYGNGNLSTSGPNNSIYAFWDDLITDISPYDQRPIYYATIGSAPNRKFIVQWTNVYFYNTTVQMGTFQVILYEGSNNIQIQYRDLLGGDRALGNSATIGIKKDNTTYKQYSANTASIAQGQSILYSPSGSSDYTVTSTTPTEGQEVSSGYDLVYLAPEGSPTSPTLVNPPNGSTGTTTTPTFEWLPVDGATSYTVLVSTVSNFSSTVVNASGQTGTSYTLGSALANGTTYYWRVQSVNSYGSSLSSTRSFTTGTANAAPSTPTSVSSSKLMGGSQSISVSGAELTATLADTDSGQQVRYRIQIATNNTFSNLVIDYRSPFADQGATNYTHGETGGTYLVGSSNTALSPGNYYLRIRTEDAASASSEWYTASGVAFEIMADTVAPNISSINTTSITANSANISWITDEAASSKIEYGLVPEFGFQTNEDNTSPRVTTHTMSLSNLKSCARYFYRVKSKDQDTNEGVSFARNFTTTGCVASIVERGEEVSVDVSLGGSLDINTANTVAALTIPANFASQNASFQINQLQDNLAPTPPPGTDIANGNLFNLVAVDTNDMQLSTFDEPITFTVTYNQSLEDVFVESSLDVYKYDGSDWIKKNCTLDIVNNTLTCSLAGFSVYGVIGTPVSTTASNSQTTSSVLGSSTTSPNAPLCSDEPPSGAPNLFQINENDTSATLFFSPVSNADSYYISYSEHTSAEGNGAQVNLSTDGVQSYTVNLLKSNTSYYFKVRAQHGCMPGEWSQIVNSKMAPFAAVDVSQIIFNDTLVSADLEKIVELEDIGTLESIKQDAQKISADIDAEDRLSPQHKFNYAFSLLWIVPVLIFIPILIVFLKKKRKRVKSR